MVSKLLLICLVVGVAASSQPAESLSGEHLNSAKKLGLRFEDRLKKSRYMEAGPGVQVTAAGWEGFPTRRYRYSVTDRDGTIKQADVILLDASAEQIARWITSALVEVGGGYSDEEGDRIFKHILAQSGGQFPVSGVVYEDILPEDGVNEIYCFRDGVTVEVDGVPHRGTTPMSAAQMAASIDGKVKRVFTYARIQSTTPQMFIDAGGPANILKESKPSAEWMTAIRLASQQAWGNDRNALLVAWLKANQK